MAKTDGFVLDKSPFEKYHCSIHAQHQFATTVIVECNNEIGISGDPMLRLAGHAANVFQDYFKHPVKMFYNTPCPMFGIALAGTFFRVYVITLTDAVNVDHSIDIDLMNKDRDHLVNIAYFMKSLKVELEKLCWFYEELNDLANAVNKTWRRDVESDRAELNGPLCADLAYIIPRPLLGVYTPQQGNAFKKLYLSADGEKVIKFTKHYGHQVHLFCSEQGCAPQLFEYKILPGGYYMVQMQNLKPQYSNVTKELFNASDTSAPLFKAELEKIMNCLLGAGFVHGDFRYENMMFRQLEDGSIGIKLVDFDFAGKANEDRYWSALNPKILWHSIAKLGEPLLPAHDVHFFDRLGECFYSSRSNRIQSQFKRPRIS